MKKITKFLIFIFIFLMLIVPVLSLAADPAPAAGLVPCDNVSKICDFNALMALVNKVINFILFYMAVPIAAIMFAYAGLLLVIGGGEAASARTKAKSIFTNAVFGLIVAVAAWLIISTVLWILGYDGSWIGLKIGL